MQARKFVGKALHHTGLRRHKPRGYDLFHDLKKIIPQPEIVMDIGANVGQSAKKYLKEFPRATIYSFEPVESTYKQMVENIGSRHGGRFRPIKIGFGPAEGRALIKTDEGTSDMFRVADDGNEEIAITTIDLFTKDFQFVDFVKIDAEGFDFEILKGATEALTRGKIGAIQVEAGLNPLNERHIPLETFKSFFESHDYYLFGMYEQMYEWITQEPHLRRCNPVFIPRAAAKALRA